MRTIRAALIAVPLAALALAGCAGGGSEPSASTPLPGGRDLDAWAETMLPPSQTGGASAVMRTSGRVGADRPISLNLSALSGAGQLQIACLTPNGSDLTATVTVDGSDDEIAVHCGAPGANVRAAVIDLAPGAAVTLHTGSSAVFVAAAIPRDEPAR